MDGFDLMTMRRRARVRVHELAKAYGVSPARISFLERQYRVTPEAEARYREALSEATGATEKPAPGPMPPDGRPRVLRVSGGKEGA